MEYSESGEYATTGRAPESEVDQQPAVENEEAQQPDPAVIFANRLEEETRAIAAQSRAEIEREVQRARGAIGEAVSHFSEQRDTYFRQVEGEVVQLALGIARRIIHRESQVDPKMIAALVHYELDQLDTATSVRLVVAPDALGYWNDAASSMPRTVEVVADRSITPGTLRMETALGSTAINFEGELKEIERGFFDLLSHRPAAEEARTARVQ
jgi:flagellar assembly protein FliH